MKKANLIFLIFIIFLGDAIGIYTLWQGWQGYPLTTDVVGAIAAAAATLALYKVIRILVKKTTEKNYSRKNKPSTGPAFMYRNWRAKRCFFKSPGVHRALHRRLVDPAGTRLSRDTRAPGQERWPLSPAPIGMGHAGCAQINRRE